MVHAKINCNGPQKTPRIPDLSNADGFPCSVCGGVFVFIIRAVFPGASLRCWSFVTSLSRWNFVVSNIIVQQWHLISIYIYFYVGKICTFTLDCCSLNFLKVLQCYVYIYRTKIKVICLNMRVAMCSLSRVSNWNIIQVSRLKMTIMNLFIHCFDFYIAEYVAKFPHSPIHHYTSIYGALLFSVSPVRCACIIKYGAVRKFFRICLCECQPALKISSFTPKHHQIYSPYCSLDIFPRYW